MNSNEKTLDVFPEPEKLIEYLERRNGKKVSLGPQRDSKGYAEGTTERDVFLEESNIGTLRLHPKSRDLFYHGKLPNTETIPCGSGTSRLDPKDGVILVYSFESRRRTDAWSNYIPFP